MPRRRRCAVGPVAILSRGFGNCRISSTAARDVWRVQYFNNMQTLILNTIEVVDMPEVALAAAEDLADSRERLGELRRVDERGLRSVGGDARFEGSLSRRRRKIGPATRLECKICWHVYDPAAGDEVWQIPPGTPFTDLPAHWTCPNCAGDKEQFMVLEMAE